MTPTESNYAQCQFPLNANFCANCGQNAKPEAIDSEYVKKELLQLVGYEKGFVFTFRKLLVSPGKSIQAYLAGDRSAFTRPLTFLLVASVVYTFVTHYYGIDLKHEAGFKSAYGQSGVVSIMQWIEQNYGYANIVMLFFIAGFTKLLFRKRAYTIYEIIALLCFAMGEGMVLLSMEPILTGYTKMQSLENIFLAIALLYVFWAIGRFFGGKFLDYLKAFLAYLLGFLIFEVLAVATGIAYDLMIG